MRRLSLAVAVVFFMIAAPAASASNGATVLNVSSCYTSGPITICSTLHLVTQERTTPSGNATYQVHERTSHVITDTNGQVISQDNGSDHIQTLTKQGVEQVSLRSASHSATYLGQTCTDFFRYHMANGALQYDEFVFSCD